MPPRKIRVLVIDDSAYNRRALVEMLEGARDLAVVGKASDGEDGIKQAIALAPDVITLDLEMPKMDGFTFLRLLGAKAPTPVIVISSYARKQDVFKALELGAFDFIAKPTRHISPALDEIREELLAKIRSVRLLRREPAPRAGSRLPRRLVVIGASTGGPAALARLLSSLPGDLPAALAVAQHMPERFTRAFAERLDRSSALRIAEAEPGAELRPGTVAIAAGGRNLLLERDAGALRALVEPPDGGDKYVPSIDRLFEAAAELYGRDTLGVVITGMGSDGKAGAAAIRAAGGDGIAESELTAAIYGMPKEVADAGVAGRILPLEEIAPAIVKFARGA